MTLTLDQARDIADKFYLRRTLHTDEDENTALLVVLLNYGDHLTSVRCIFGEWSGIKGDLSFRDGIPLCPNGHPLFESRNKMRLSLIETTE